MAVDSQTGRIYKDVEGDDGLSIAQVARALTRSTQDLGQLCGDFKLESNNTRTALHRINPWAKWKPYRSSKLETEYLTQSTSLTHRRKFGLHWPEFGSPTSVNNSGVKLYQVYDNDTETNLKKVMNGWVYQTPRGKGQGDLGENEWFRLLDFDNYYHNANTPLLLPPADITVSTQAAQTMPISAIKNEDPLPYEITLADFSDLSTYHFCVVGYLLVGDIPANPNFFVETNSTALGDNGGYSVSPKFTPQHFAGKLGTWYVYPCLCSRGDISFYQVPDSSDSDSSLKEATYIPLPCTKKWIIFVTSTQRRAILTADKTSQTHTSVKFTITLVNESSNRYNFDDVTVWLYHAGRDPETDFKLTDEQEITIPAQMVEAGQQVTYDYYYTHPVTILPSLWQDLVLFATGGSNFAKVGPIAAIVPSNAEQSNNQ